jgi:hypothetical protein
MEGYRPAFDSDIELADAETADVELAQAAPAGPPPILAQAQVTSFDPACLPPPPEPYSLDGFTAIIPADVFRRSKPPL